MAPFPDYNPNYEERRGRYAPADGQHNLQPHEQATSNKQNTTLNTKEVAQEPSQDEAERHRHNDES